MLISPTTVFSTTLISSREKERQREIKTRTQSYCVGTRLLLYFCVLWNFFLRKQARQGLTSLFALPLKTRDTQSGKKRELLNCENERKKRRACVTKSPLLLAGLDGNGPALARRLPGDPQSARPDEGGGPAPQPEVRNGQETSAHQTEASGFRDVSDRHSYPR
jgi:hypothetical protein